MEYDGLLEHKEQIELDILMMESHGMGQVLEMLYLRQHVLRSHGTELYGSLEDQEIIHLGIPLTESPGLRPLLEMLYLRQDV
jgi:hypothetical protein